MIEVFGVMPSCRISCTPITAPKMHRMIRKISVAGAKVEGCWGSAALDGTAPPAGARDRSLIGMPQLRASGRFRYRMERPGLPMVLSAVGRRQPTARVLHRGRVRLSFAAGAGVAQWQSRSFPSLRRGVDSLYPLPYF